MIGTKICQIVIFFSILKFFNLIPFWFVVTYVIIKYSKIKYLGFKMSTPFPLNKSFKDGLQKLIW